MALSKLMYIICLRVVVKTLVGINDILLIVTFTGFEQIHFFPTERFSSRGMILYINCYMNGIMINELIKDSLYNWLKGMDYFRWSAH